MADLKKEEEKDHLKVPIKLFLMNTYLFNARRIRYGLLKKQV